jgi:putative ABC transport system permease protein
MADRVSEGIARLVIYAFSRRFRDRVGHDMVDAFVCYCRSARRRGRLAFVRAILRASAESAFQGIADRIDRRSAHRRRFANPAPFFIPDDGSATMASWLRDLRFGLRSLRRSPGFTATVVLVLSLGIGATTAMFSVVDALTLRGLPFERTHELIRITETYQPEAGPMERRAASYPDYRDWVEGTSAFAHLAIVDDDQVTLAVSEADPFQLPAEFVSPNYFTVLGTIPAAGRILQESDDRTNAPVAVLSHTAWRSRFGEDPDLVGRTVEINGALVPVIGVAQPGFRGAFDDTDIWFPVRAQGALVPTEPAEQLEVRTSRGFFVMGRLRPGVTLVEAQRQIDLVTSSLQETGEVPVNRGATVLSFEEEYLGDARRTATLLLGAVGLVLLIACTNVATLTFARQLGRTQQVAVERALGASRVAVIRRQVMESGILALTGGGLGLVTAIGLAQFLLADGLAGVPTYIRPDLSVVGAAFAVVVSVGVALVIGLLPAMVSSKISGAAAARGAGRSVSDVGGGRVPWRQFLVAGQVASAVALLIGAGLVFRSVRSQLAIDPGFDSQSVAVAQVNLPAGRYPDDAARAAFADRLERELDAAAGITDATIASDVPLMSGYSAIDVRVDGDPQAEESIRVYRHRVSPRYFATLGIPIIRGRPFETTDIMGGTRSIIVSQTFADRYWPDQAPIGKRVSGMVVVGVAGDARFRSLVPNQSTSPDDPDVFLALAQFPTTDLAIMARTRGSTEGAHQQIDDALRRIDPSLPLFNRTSLDEQISSEVASATALSRQLGTFAGLAIALAVAGLYGVMAYNVGRRTNEIGLRMALGANERRVLGMVMGQGTRMVGSGLLIGMAAAVILSRMLRDQLYEVSTLDPTTYGVVGALFLSAGLIAAFLPARRATRISPLEALRE